MYLFLRFVISGLVPPKYICILHYCFAHIITVYSICEVVSKACKLFRLVANLDRDLSALSLRN